MDQAAALKAVQLAEAFKKRTVPGFGASAVRAGYAPTSEGRLQYAARVLQSPSAFDPEVVEEARRQSWMVQ